MLRWASRQPSAKDRARLVKEVRKHAHQLLTLAEAVERDANVEA